MGAVIELPFTFRSVLLPFSQTAFSPQRSLRMREGRKVNLGGNGFLFVRSNYGFLFYNAPELNLFRPLMSV